MNKLSHKGYTGSIEVSFGDNCLHGRILFIDDIVTYEGETVDELATSFKDAVDRYVARQGLKHSTACIYAKHTAN